MQRALGKLPIGEWLPRYQRAWLRGDLLAAATVWALVVPQAIAYAQIAGLPPQAGLYASFAGLLGYALFGTSRQVIVSPTSSTAAISAAIVGSVALSDPSRFGELSSALALLVGLSFVVFGFAQVGFISRFIAPTVQAGFLFGLGMTIIVGQVPDLLGLSHGRGNFFPQLWHVLTSLPQLNPWTAALGLGSLAALFALKRWAPRLPAALIMVVVSIVLVTALGLSAEGVRVIGVVDAKLSPPALPRVGFEDLIMLLPGALAVSVIGFAETVTVAEQFAEKHKYEIRPNQELIGVGVANLLAGLFQGFIVGGGASQSAANDAAGARSQLVSIFVSALTILTLLFLLPLFQDLPQAVLAAIVIVAVSGFLNVYALRRIARLRRDGFLLALFALLSTLVLGILPGLLIAIAVSIALLLGYLARPKTSVLGKPADSQAYVSLTANPDAETTPRLLLFRLDAPLLALNAKRMRDHLRTRLRETQPPVRVVVLDLSSTDELDISAIDTLIAIDAELREQGRALWLANTHAGVTKFLRSKALAETLGRVPVYATLAAAVSAFNALPVPAAPPPDEIGSSKPA